MFKKILIANRGEIACRIIRTCQRMGIRTTAIYSKADERAVHVEMADEAVFIGPSPALQSYLSITNIIQAAQKCGADAIHPGYGFLSENAEFAVVVEAVGITFIGPSAPAIRQMGDKLQAKKLAQEAGVNLVPGSEFPLANRSQIEEFATSHGYPLLLKAAAGGGGKGMRILRGPDDIEESLQGTTREAQASFGDNRIFVEKYLDHARHIEIQILADTHGNVVHLGERDCSLQRRHQKVIEETPSPFMTPELREAMTAQAVALAKHVGYVSAGTMEFMVTPDHQFYFLEMNTRLQVEHPVTEMVTSLDLVEQMIRIAAGEPLPFTQDQISFSGHAIEARLYAEDPDNDFLPSSGRLTRIEIPLDDGVRVDTGVEPGSEVSIYYDPMIAKIIAYAPTRQEALENLQKSLSCCVIEGLSHNRGFLEQLIRNAEIQKGNYTTQFIETVVPILETPGQLVLMRTLAAMIFHRNAIQDTQGDWVVVDKGKSELIEINGSKIKVSEQTFEITLSWLPRERFFKATVGRQNYYGQVHLNVMDIRITLLGFDLTFQVMPPHVWKLSFHLPPIAPDVDVNTIQAPMPGTLTRLLVSKGDKVKKGQTLLVIEAMKMENALKAPKDATVEDVFVNEGDIVGRNQDLMKLI